MNTFACPHCHARIELAGPWIDHDGTFRYKPSLRCAECSAALPPETIEACVQAAMVATMLHQGGSVDAAKAAAQGHFKDAVALSRLDTIDFTASILAFLKHVDS